MAHSVLTIRTTPGGAEYRLESPLGSPTRQPRPILKPGRAGRQVQFVEPIVRVLDDDEEEQGMEAEDVPARSNAGSGHGNESAEASLGSHGWYHMPPTWQTPPQMASMFTDPGLQFPQQQEQQQRQQQQQWLQHGHPPPMSAPPYQVPADPGSPAMEARHLELHANTITISLAGRQFVQQQQPQPQLPPQQAEAQPRPPPQGGPLGGEQAPNASASQQPDEPQLLQAASSGATPLEQHPAQYQRQQPTMATAETQTRDPSPPREPLPPLDAPADPAAAVAAAAAARTAAGCELPSVPLLPLPPGLHVTSKSNRQAGAHRQQPAHSSEDQELGSAENSALSWRRPAGGNGTATSGSLSSGLSPRDGQPRSKAWNPAEALQVSCVWFSM